MKKPHTDLLPVKSEPEASEKLIEVSRNNDYITGNLLRYLYHQNYYKHIGIDLSRQTNMITLQLIKYAGKSGKIMVWQWQGLLTQRPSPDPKCKFIISSFLTFSHLLDCTRNAMYILLLLQVMGEGDR